MKAKVLQILKAVWAVMSRHVVLKLLSVIFAVILWSYVISNNTSITRVKVIGGLTGYVTGQSSLEVYDLALLTDPTQALSDIDVQVQVPQASYSLANSANVQVTLDLSSVRTAGVQEVPLKATTSYGKVVGIRPSSLPLTFEPLDSRSVPVNVEMTGTDDKHYWYNCSRINPQQITVSGATSLVQSIASAVVQVDLNDRNVSFYTSRGIELMDNSGNLLSGSMLNRSSATASLSMDVYPTKELDISTVQDDVLLGQIAQGYVVESITVQPKSVTVAADEELLDAVDHLVIEPIEVDQPTQSFTRKASISGLSDFKYISSEQVYVNVTIAEETIGTWLEEVPITYLGKADPLTLSAPRSTAVYVTGPRSRVKELSSASVALTVDLSGLEAGEYTLGVHLDDSAFPNLNFDIDAAEVTVTLTEPEEEE